MEQHANLVQLTEIKQRLGQLTDNELFGEKIEEVLSELKNTLVALEADPQIDKARLTNLSTFVSGRKSLDPMVRNVLLGLIEKFIKATYPPTEETVNEQVQIPNIDQPEQEQNNLEVKKLGEMPNMESLIGKIPGLGEALRKAGSFDENVQTPADLALADHGLMHQEEQVSAVLVDPEEEMAAAAAPAEIIGFNTRELLGFFLQESFEQVETFANGLLELEKERANLELVNELFRAAHTLKGGSGTMGFSAIVRITHLAEDVLDVLRQGKITVTPTIIDTLLNVADRVKSMLDNIQNGGDGQLEVDDLVGRLEACLNSGSTENQLADDAQRAHHAQPVIESIPANDLKSTIFELDQNSLSRIRELQNSGLKVCELLVKFSSKILMPSVRSVMAIKRLEKYARILQTFPLAEELRMESHPEFHILLATDKDINMLEKMVLQISEIEAVSSRLFPQVEAPVQGNDSVDATKKHIPILGSGIGEAVQKAESEVNAKPLKNQTIRVQTERLDDLLNLVGEMVITRTRLVSVSTALNGSVAQEQVLNSLNETTVYLGRLMNELQESVMAMRMVPIGQVFSRFPRLVRDLARQTGKEIELVCIGEETELDKTIIEEIGTPLVHIIRNSIDHGIESADERVANGKPAKGTVTVEAFHEGSHIVIAVSDDGKGIDLNSVKEKAITQGFINSTDDFSDKDLANLIFLPGLSTARQITDVSGRGVGMDAVKKSLVNLGGMIDIDTVQGKGTTFTIRLPLTLAIIQALLVEVDSETYAIPLASVLETLRVHKPELKTVGGHAIIQLRGNTLPLISLREHFGYDKAIEEDNEVVYVVVVGFGEKRLGLIVDGLTGQQEIVIKSLGEFLANVPGFSGATISGDGKVTLIVDVGSLIQDTLVNRV